MWFEHLDFDLLKCLLNKICFKFHGDSEKSKISISLISNLKKTKNVIEK